MTKTLLSKPIKSKSVLDWSLFLGNFLVWTGVYLGLNGQLKLGAMSQLRVEIVATPKTVKITSWSAAGEFDHGYINTPKIINLSSTTQKLSLSRPGYVTESLPVLKNEPESQHQIVIAELAPTSQQKHRLRIERLETSSDDHKNQNIQPSEIRVRIDGGLYSGPIPFEANDVLSGGHQVEFYFDSKPQPTPPCHFQINEIAKSTATKTHTITIGQPAGAKNYVIRGCMIRK